MLTTRSSQGLAAYRREILSLSPAAWFRAGEGQTVTGSGVSQWDDQSGNGRHLLQGTDSARPALQADGSVLFNGTAHYLKCNAFTLNQPTTVIAAIKQVSWTSGDYLFDGDSGASGLLAQSGASPNLVFNTTGGTNTSLTGEPAIGTTFIVRVTFNGASSSGAINLGAAATGNAGTTNMGGFTLGATPVPGNYANIQAYEVLILPVAPSTAQLDRIVAQMMAIYSVS